MDKRKRSIWSPEDKLVFYKKLLHFLDTNTNNVKYPRDLAPFYDEMMTLFGGKYSRDQLHEAKRRGKDRLIAILSKQLQNQPLNKDDEDFFATASQIWDNTGQMIAMAYTLRGACGDADRAPPSSAVAAARGRHALEKQKKSEKRAAEPPKKKNAKKKKEATSDDGEELELESYEEMRRHLRIHGIDVAEFLGKMKVETNDDTLALPILFARDLGWKAPPKYERDAAKHALDTLDVLVQRLDFIHDVLTEEAKLCST